MNTKQKIKYKQAATVVGLGSQLPVQRCLPGSVNACKKVLGGRCIIFRLAITGFGPGLPCRAAAGPAVELQSGLLVIATQQQTVKLGQSVSGHLPNTAETQPMLSLPVYRSNHCKI